MTQRCGLVAVLGAPNAGKSTLVNALVGQKVAIVSPKAQTTRARLMGIAIAGDAQILLVDTPGIFAPNRRLDRAMVAAAWEGAEGADRVVLVVDAAAKLGQRVEAMLAEVEQRREPKILVLNKVDLVNKDGNSVADMAFGPSRFFIPKPDTVALLVKLGSPFQNNCRSDQCVDGKFFGGPVAK